MNMNDKAIIIPMQMEEKKAKESIMDDEAIIALYIKRSERAVEVTAEKYGALCRSVAYDILRSREDAEECVNDTYLSAWESIPPDHPSNLGAYLCRITRNRALNMIRESSAQKRGGVQYDMLLGELDDIVPDSGGDIADTVALRTAMTKFLTGLDPKSRMVFMRRYWYMRSTREIARDFKLSETTVRVTLHRVRKKLKKYLEENGIRF